VTNFRARALNISTFFPLEIKNNMQIEKFKNKNQFG